ncbi:MAG: chromosomal replication initiator protein DnaA [Gemmatimonadales bacterium]
MPLTESVEVWDHAAKLLTDQVSQAAWKAWFEHLTPLWADEDEFHLAAPSPVTKDRLETRFSALLQDAVDAAAGRHLRIRLTVCTEAGSPGEGGGAGAERALPPATTGTGTRTARTPPSDGRGRLVNTFENFVIGASNRFAHAAALSVAEQPAKAYNPLFIHGKSGLGKTHLIHAIGNYVDQLYPGLRVCYVTGERFTNEFINAIRTNTTPDFKHRYRACDLLLVDDVEFLEYKEGTQEEFFYTFNSIYEAGGQIVLTCDRHARALGTLEDRLRSRFLSGLITDVQPPDLETRLAILRRRAQNSEPQPADEVLELIAVHIRNNIRELEGALTRISAYAHFTQQPVSKGLAEQVLADLISSDEPGQITPKRILDTTAAMFGFSLDELCGPSRRRPLVTARQICMYVFRELTDFSYPAIGREFGNRDHTTVIHAVEKISTQMRERRQIFDQVTELIHQIKKPA